MKTLEITEAAANFTRVLREVRAEHESFEIVQQGVPCAYLIPAVEHVSSSHDLADALAADPLDAEDRRTLAADLRRARQTLKPCRNPWG